MADENSSDEGSVGDGKLGVGAPVLEGELPNDPPEPEESTKDVGDAGKAAIAAERAKAKEATKANKALEKQISAMQVELAKVQDQKLSAEERAVKEARREASAEVETKYQALLLKEKVKAAATATFADPEDAVALGDWSLIDSYDDIEGIQSVLSDLLESKPHLAAKPSTPPPLAGGNGSPAKAGGGMNSLLRQAVGATK